MTLAFFRLFPPLLVAFMLAPAPTQAWENYSGKSFTAYVQMVDEGNTLEVRENKGRPGKTLMVRFYGIGIPTQRQPFGARAHEELIKMLPEGQKIIVTTVNEDERGVASALVQMADHSINNRLIDEGLAWVDRSSCKAFFCRRWHIQEHLAIKEKRGIWSLNLASPPWQWGE